jgi:hypothetical protein
VDPSGTFMDVYGSILELVDSNLMSRMILTSNSDPSSQQECASYCNVASTDCMFFHFDTTICYIGMFGVETGSFSGNKGTKVVAVNDGTHPNHSRFRDKNTF